MKKKLFGRMDSIVNLMEFVPDEMFRLEFSILGFLIPIFLI
jgi:hypothetical protein